MKKVEIDFVTTYKILRSITDLYKKNDFEIDEVFLESILTVEVQIAVELGRDDFKMVNIDYNKVDYKLCRRVAGYLQDVEDYLPYTLRRLASYWLDEYISVKVKEDE